MVKLGRTRETILFYTAKPGIFEKAKGLRAEMTEAEMKLWLKIRKNQLFGFKFRRQHPIFLFIVDFYCHKAKLVIEIDGKVHEDPEQKEYDEQRTYELEHLGLKVIWFSNEDVLKNIDYVIRQIREQLKKSPL